MWNTRVSRVDGEIQVSIVALIPTIGPAEVFSQRSMPEALTPTLTFFKYESKMDSSTKRTTASIIVVASLLTGWSALASETSLPSLRMLPSVASDATAQAGFPATQYPMTSAQPVQSYTLLGQSNHGLAVDSTPVAVEPNNLLMVGKPVELHEIGFTSETYDVQVLSDELAKELNKEQMIDGNIKVVSVEVVSDEAEPNTTNESVEPSQEAAEPGAYTAGEYPCGGCGDGVTCCTPPVVCCPPPVRRPTFWTGGVEATFLAPDLNNGFVSYNLIDTIASPAVDETFGSRTGEDLDNLYIAPRLWLGIQRCNWGIQGRYWHLRANAEDYDPFVFAPGYTGDHLTDIGYFAYSQFDAYTTDLEGTYSFCCCDTKHTFSFGARYARAEHVAGLDSFADVNNAAGGTGLIYGAAHINRGMEGVGLTSSWTGRKPLFCNSCIHLIGGLRGSILWGESWAVAETRVAEQTAGPPAAGAASTNSAYYSDDDAIFIGEAIAGLEWNYRVQCFPADAFFRIVGEYQNWQSANGIAQATSFAGFGTTPSFSQGLATASANTLGFDLYGFSISTGFTW